jgi:hypothetical protein
VILVVAGRVCAKQRGRIDRRQGRSALASGEPAAMRRAQAPIRGGEELPVGHRSYPMSVDNVVGLIGLLVFIAAIVGLAAGVTWVVVRVSPTPKSTKN